ncbi:MULTISPECIES: thioesterase II family protein [unclassified Streptomyces]|uniref:thioesterase II family protein n=1 Tax=unclassified Streptomyces TaxID=2593676 RepID=UPI002DDC0F6F|nr:MULTISPECIES: thioesterase II family protein [unclassified Streptomyces]WSC39360.1 thioesterase II family protein [Streptomyces sp. NBC_01763]WSC53514.1 thioesterase II family protein [Streptomyces sp. NBC_01761]WSF84355.1 thioesterase II family protein [Streptomyces sp. NBC_01744]
MVNSSPTTGPSWIKRFHPAPEAATRLVCFPYAGGSAGYYHGMSAKVSPKVELLAVQYPGRQDRYAEKPVDDIGELADEITEALLPGALEKPLALFGHSMGASVAFEVARRLEHRGVTPSALFVSARPGPSANRNETLHLSTDADLEREIRSLGGTGAEVLNDEEILQMVLPVVRNDYRAAETYRYVPGPDVTCPVVAFVGEGDPKATVAETGVWERHTTGPFDLTVFPGGHFYLNEHQAAVVGALLRQLTPAGTPRR